MMTKAAVPFSQPAKWDVCEVGHDEPSAQRRICGRPIQRPLACSTDSGGLPVRAFLDGKSRLSNLLPEERSRLLRDSAEKVVRAAADMPVAVVSGNPGVQAWAASLGLVVLDDPGPLDQAAATGTRWAAGLGIG